MKKFFVTNIKIKLVIINLVSNNILMKSMISNLIKLIQECGILMKKMTLDDF